MLRELYASFNEVEDCSPLAQCELLETVDLEGNRMATLEVRARVPCLIATRRDETQTQP